MNFSRAAVVVSLLSLLTVFPSAAQNSSQNSKNGPATSHPSGVQEYSGLYTFLKDGEFVQISVEDERRVTGFISRYGDGESDKGEFLDQYFRTAKLEGRQLSFVTETVHGVWFEFKGTVDRGAGKNRGEDAYYVLKGTLTANSSDAQKKVTSHPQEVMFQMFPADASPVPAARK